MHVLQPLNSLTEVFNDRETAVRLNGPDEVDLASIPSIIEGLALAQLSLHLLGSLNDYRSVCERGQIEGVARAVIVANLA